jgi:YD repeat-containing protein
LAPINVTATNGTLYFDAFESRRSIYIGPIGGGTVTTTITYQYDPLYRLTQANYSDGRYFHYTYDAVGNRLTQTVCLGTPTCTPVNSTYVSIVISTDRGRVGKVIRHEKESPV